jgi:hypothetical protein
MTNPNKTFRDANFTGHTLEQYFTDTTLNWVGSRRIINGKDRANEIAMYAQAFYGALQFEGEIPEVKPNMEIISFDPEAARAEALHGETIEVDGEVYGAILEAA